MEVIKIPRDIMDKVDAGLAAERGQTVEEFRASLRAEADKHWCSCPSGKDPMVNPWVFHDDGRRTNQHCPRKHHYHCPKCKRLTQVG